VRVIFHGKTSWVLRDSFIDEEQKECGEENCGEEKVLNKNGNVVARKVWFRKKYFVCIYAHT
jgi:hypothetical protein